MKCKILIIALLLTVCTCAAAREKYNFNSGWLLKVGDIPGASKASFKDKGWQEVTLPHAFNEDEAFKLDIHSLTDTVMWYRKHFVLPSTVRARKVFLEFEGARQGVKVFVNGSFAGSHDNGVMAFGIDISPWVKPGRNVVAVRVDNDWDYKQEGEEVKYQWSDRNFNANYGGLPKNVWLHITDKLYQTLPLYSNLGTTGTYIYAKEIDVRNGSAVLHAESEVKNETGRSVGAAYEVRLIDRDGSTLKTFSSAPVSIAAGQTVTLSAEAAVEGLHFWSWGYGYLYTVRTSLVVDGTVSDQVETRTGFRKTRFADGKFWLNDRVLQVKGFAQRTSNEWPALGMSVPAWLSDYSNGLMVGCNANLVRWMHITPWKQDIESCDRVGLMEAMPAGDAERDVEGVQWEQRKALMRDAIIYNRNNPSIIFYECGNKAISREHMLEMKEIRDRYDFWGGRAIGSREMLDVPEAEYGGEMLYINKSARSPFWAMEYCRDEALRKYWDEWSYPWHREGDGDDMVWSVSQNSYVPSGGGAYNHNRERPGTGKRVSSGGVNIIFSDSNTHFRGVENYRRSGVTDPLRIPKDSYFAHQVMWDGWVDTEVPRIYIVGHWNYEPGTVKPVFVVSNTDEVALFLNGRELGPCRRESHFLFTFPDVAFEEGELVAVAYDNGREAARYSLETAGEPAALRLSSIVNPDGWKADGADIALVQIEVVDARGRRCPLANEMIHYELEGPAEWRGGLAQGPDNYILSRDFPVECGVNRAILRSSVSPGKVTLRASAEGLKGAAITLETVECKSSGGLSTYIPADHLQGRLARGETPLTPSYTDKAVDVLITSASAGSNSEKAAMSFDDNELSEWASDTIAANAWITYYFGRMAQVDEVCLKLAGWRQRSYPLEILAGDELLWEGDTERSLGYIHIPVKPVMAREMTIKLKESAGAGRDLRIVEAEFKETILPEAVRNR